jgi:hypothetical protein
MKFRINTYQLFFTLVFLVITSSVFAEGLNDEDVDNQNYISIQGSSNVNEFHLMNSDLQLDELDGGTERNSLYRNIRIAVDGFTADNQRMVRDFREMVNESRYPFIKIGIERRKMADFEETSGLTKFSIIITIAGKSKEYKVPCEIFSSVDSGYIISGNFSVKLTDFGIEPPEKLLGLIKVNNEVFINFLFNFDSEEVLTKK